MVTSELPRISVSVKAAIVRSGSILLIRYDNSEFHSSPTHYNLPGGKARDGEPLRDAVRRKVRQETCANVRSERLLFVVEYVPERWDGAFGSTQKVQFNFLASLDEGAEARLPDDCADGESAIEWIPLDDLPDVPLLPRVQGPLVAALRDGKNIDPFVDCW